MKKILLLSVLLFSLMLIVVPVGYAGNPPPPPPDMKFVGPAIEGTIMIMPGCNQGEFIATFFGHCPGIPFAIGPNSYLGDFEAVTPELLEGQNLGYVGDQIPLECAPRKGGGYGTEVKIFHVTHFTKIGNLIKARVVAKFLVPK